MADNAKRVIGKRKINRYCPFTQTSLPHVQACVADVTEALGEHMAPFVEGAGLLAFLLTALADSEAEVCSNAAFALGKVGACSNQAWELCGGL